MPTRICHIVNGDIWAGAEVQSYSLIQALWGQPDIAIQAILFNEGILATKLRDEGIKVDIVQEDQLNLCSMVHTVRTILKTEGIELVHVHGFKENFVGGIAAKLSRVKGIIRTHHGRGMVGVRGRNGYVERINATILTDKLIAVSSELRDFLVHEGFKGSKISVVQNGIDPDSVRPNNGIEEVRKQFGIPRDKMVIGTIGRVEPVKGPTYFLRGAKMIAGTRNDVFFAMVGDGSLLEEMRGYAKKLAIDSITLFPGFSRTPIDWLQGFDVFGLTSLHEGIPMVLLEAMALGKPIIASSVGGIPDVIKDGYSGLLVTPEDPFAFAASVCKLLDDEHLRKYLGDNARKEVFEKFSLNQTIIQTKEVYSKFE